MSIDVIGNFLTIIRNGLMASKSSVLVPHTKMNVAIARILKDEGFIKDAVVVEQEDSAVKKIKIMLKYVDGESVIHDITRVSRPGRRIYNSINAVRPVIGGLGISILTTNRGVISQKKAKELGIGGEVICTVW
jgi:small subunit ribosomal protein S8